MKQVKIIFVSLLLAVCMIFTYLPAAAAPAAERADIEYDASDGQSETSAIDQSAVDTEMKEKADILINQGGILL